MMAVMMMPVMVVIGMILRRGGDRAGQQECEYQECLHALLGCA